MRGKKEITTSGVRRDETECLWIVQNLQGKNKLVLTEKICKQGEVVETSKNKRQTDK